MTLAGLALMLGLAAAPGHVSGHVSGHKTEKPKGLYLTGGASEGTAIFINLATVAEAPAGTFRFWHLVVNSDDQVEDGIKYRQILAEVKCSARTLRTLDAFGYGTDDSIIYHLEQPDSPQAIAPETLGEGVYNAVCTRNGLKHPDSRRTVADLHAAIRYTDELYARKSRIAEGGAGAGSAGDFAERGYTDMAAKRDDSAFDNFDQAIALGSRDPGVFLGRGYLYFAKADLVHAKADYDRAIALDASNANAYAGRADVNRFLGEYDAAVRDASQALTLKSDLSYAYAVRGLTFRDAKQWDLALADLNAALELNPQDFEALEGRGDVYTERKSYEQAVSDYGRSLAIAPEMDGIYVKRAYAYAFAGNFDAAIKDCDKAIALNADNAEAAKLRALAYKGKAADAGALPQAKIG